MTQNPGCIPNNIHKTKDLKKIKKIINKCSKCQKLKPKNAHHCSICQQCIIKLDHHCPWINNCVGFLNQKFFLLFLFWTEIICLWCLVTLIKRLIICSNMKLLVNSNSCFLNFKDKYFCFFNLVESIIFGFFIFIILTDQLTVIYENTTYIDKLKGAINEKKSKYECVKSVFGENVSINWILPKRIPEKIRDDFIKLCTTFDIQ